ncbi:MAG: polyprenyl diphosphate synthase [Bacilli bacterium]|nr:polyprenyl diphosphate synthase [Bacilli bacterium]
MDKQNQLQHVAFIMDGNGRWAKKRHLPRHLGHKEGCERVIEIYEECYDQGIRVMSLYAFSTENWSRPKAEINHLFNYLELFFKREIDRLIRDGSKVIVSGDVSQLPPKIRKTISESIKLTENCKNFTFNICLNYGGKAEILRAVKGIAEDYKNGTISLDEITENKFEDYLYTKGLPPVDLLIRTSGELRTSNFLPWQLAYSEFMFPTTTWPDFTKEEFRKCLDEFKNRNRRFGGLSNEEK